MLALSTVALPTYLPGPQGREMGIEGRKEVACFWHALHICVSKSNQCIPFPSFPLTQPMPFPNSALAPNPEPQQPRIKPCQQASTSLLLRVRYITMALLTSLARSVTLPPFRVPVLVHVGASMGSPALLCSAVLGQKHCVHDGAREGHRTGCRD